MKEEMRTFGYLCPQCGKTVMGTRSVFALEASNAEVECACGKSALKVEFDGTEYHIYVPCGICGETHEAHCPPERVLRGATALAAPRRGNSAALSARRDGEKNLRIWRCWRRRSTSSRGRRRGICGQRHHVRDPV